MPQGWPFIGFARIGNEKKGRRNVFSASTYLSMIVIADDITGAAEIAGIAFERGLRVRLVCGATEIPDVPKNDNFSIVNGTLVIATDTRSMSEQEAVAETKRLAAALNERVSLSPSTFQKDTFIFKKVDSALRGHVVAELQTLMEATGMKRAVYLPANPSKGRIIKDGIYYIKEKGKEVPIAETAFSFDPEFPANTSMLCERFPDAREKGIIMPDAENEGDLLHAIDSYNDGYTLFAGAADLFSLLISSSSFEHFSCPPLPDKPSTFNSDLSCHTLLEKSSTLNSDFYKDENRGLLILCGSTQSGPTGLSLPVSPMPLNVYDGADDITTWLSDAIGKYTDMGSLILTIPHRHRIGHDAAVHLRQMMTKMACRLMEQQQPKHLIIEGGATAYSVLHLLGRSLFEVVCQWAPGVVSLGKPDAPIVTLKPGSYSWGTLFSK